MPVDSGGKSLSDLRFARKVCPAFVGDCAEICVGKSIDLRRTRIENDMCRCNCWLAYATPVVARLALPRSATAFLFKRTESPLRLDFPKHDW